MMTSTTTKFSQVVSADKATQPTGSAVKASHTNNSIPSAFTPSTFAPLNHSIRPAYANEYPQPNVLVQGWVTECPPYLSIPPNPTTGSGYFSVSINQDFMSHLDTQAETFAKMCEARAFAHSMAKSESENLSYDEAYTFAKFHSTEAYHQARKEAEKSNRDLLNKYALEKLHEHKLKQDQSLSLVPAPPQMIQSSTQSSTQSSIQILAQPPCQMKQNQAQGSIKILANMHRLDACADAPDSDDEVADIAEAESVPPLVASVASKKVQQTNAKPKSIGAISASSVITASHSTETGKVDQHLVDAKVEVMMAEFKDSTRPKSPSYSAAVAAPATTTGAKPLHSTTGGENKFKLVQKKPTSTITSGGEKSDKPSVWTRKIGDRLKTYCFSGYKNLETHAVEKPFDFRSTCKANHVSFNWDLTLGTVTLASWDREQLNTSIGQLTKIIDSFEVDVQQKSSSQGKQKK